MHELAAEGVGEPDFRGVGRAKRIDTREEMSAFLTGSFVLASRVCARTIEPRIRTSRRGGGSARDSASNRLDQLNTFLNRAARERRNDWRLVRNRACVCASAGSRLTGGLAPAIAPIRGAQGGSSHNASGVGSPGGKGAQISGHFALMGGESLTIIVGGAGGNGAYSGGGGGGSFVIAPGNNLLIAAGGGGGAGGSSSYKESNGYAGEAVTVGDDGSGTVFNQGVGGSLGSGGSWGTFGGGGGGGGFKGDGTGGTKNYTGYGGLSQGKGGAGSRAGFAGDGGFGGGGGGGTSDASGSKYCSFCFGGGGGGGGYGGGGGGEGDRVPPFHPFVIFGGGGGGGGSFNLGTYAMGLPGIRAGNGEVDITEFIVRGAPAVPEPSTWAMTPTGFAGLGWLARLRRRKLTPA